MKLMPKSLKKGFTLVELLITVVIVGVLASILIPKFSNNSDKARTTANLASLKSLDTAADVFIIDGGSVTLDQTADGMLDSDDRAALVSALANAGKLVLSGTPAEQAAKFRAYADFNGTKLSSVTIMQYQDKATDPYAVNANKTVNSALGLESATVTGPADFVGLNGTEAPLAWPY